MRTCHAALTPTDSRKPSPVRIYGVSGQSRCVAGCANFTDFRLCRTRAQLAPVSAHLSICRNFATALPGSSSQGRHWTSRHRADRPAPACMHVQAWLYRGDRNHARHPGSAPKRMRLEAIEADSQARARIVQRTETVRSRKFSPQRLGILCPGSRRVPGTRGIASQDLPKSLTLLKKWRSNGRGYGSRKTSP